MWDDVRISAADAPPWKANPVVNNDGPTFDPPGERRGVLRSIGANIRLVAVCLLVGGLLGYVVAFLLPKSYTSEASFYLGADAPFTPMQSNGGGNTEQFAGAQAELVRTAEVLTGAAHRVTPPLALTEVRDSISISSADTGRVTVATQRPTAEEAQALADAVVTSYREVVARRVQALAAQAAATTTDQTQLQDIALRAVAYGDGVVAVEPAFLPTAASSPRPMQNALLGALVGLMLGAALSVVREQRRARLVSVADLDTLVGAPLITRYPAPASPAADAMVRDPWSDAGRAASDVLATVEVTLEGSQCPSLLLVSWQRAQTTTSLAASIAVAAAHAGRRVTLIDGGLKEHGIGAVTGVETGAGLEELARPESPIDASVRTWNVGETEIAVVPGDVPASAGGSPRPTGLAARPQTLRSAISRLAETTDLVLVDGPPLTERPLGLALGRGVDCVVLVIDEETSVDDAHDMGRRIALSGVSVVGYVLAAAAPRSPVQRIVQQARRSGEGALASLRSPHQR